MAIKNRFIWLKSEESLNNKIQNNEILDDSVVFTKDGIIHTQGTSFYTLNSTKTIDASRIVGIISPDNLPSSVKERLYIVSTDEDRFNLTTNEVQNGDIVKVNDTKTMYLVKDDSKLNSEDGYEEFVAGIAASVPWEGVTDAPNFITKDDADTYYYPYSGRDNMSIKSDGSPVLANNSSLYFKNSNGEEISVLKVLTDDSLVLGDDKNKYIYAISELKIKDNKCITFLHSPGLYTGIRWEDNSTGNKLSAIVYNKSIQKIYVLPNLKDNFYEITDGLQITPTNITFNGNELATQLYVQTNYALNKYYNVFSNRPNIKVGADGNNDLLLTIGSSNTLYINSTTPTDQIIPTQIVWYAGNTSSYSNHVLGKLTTYGGILNNQLNSDSIIESRASTDHFGALVLASGSTASSIVVSDTLSQDGTVYFNIGRTGNYNIFINRTSIRVPAVDCITEDGSYFRIKAITGGGANRYACIIDSSGESTKFAVGGLCVGNRYLEYMSNIPTNGIYSLGDIKTSGSIITDRIYNSSGTNAILDYNRITSGYTTIGCWDTGSIIRSGNNNLVHRKHTTDAASFTDYMIYDSGNLTPLRYTTLGSNVNINTLTIQGFYEQGSNAYATLELGYPIEEAGLLISGIGAYKGTCQIYGSHYANRWFVRGGGRSNNEGGSTAHSDWAEIITTNNINNYLPEGGLGGTGTDNCIAVFNGTNALKAGPQLGTEQYRFLNNEGKWTYPILINGIYTSNGGAVEPNYVKSTFVRFNMAKYTNVCNSYLDWILMDCYGGSDVPYVTAIGVTKSASPSAYIMSAPKGSNDINSWVHKQLATTDLYASSSTGGVIKLGYTESEKNYAVKVNSSGQAYVTVPWESGGSYSLPLAANGTRGGIQIGFTESESNLALRLSSEKGYITLTKSAIVSALGYTPPSTDTNTHYTTYIYAGASGTVENSAVSNPYIKIVDDSTYRNQIRLIGSGTTSISSDASGNITISSTNTIYTLPMATSTTLGGVKLGYVDSSTDGVVYNLGVNINDYGKLYVPITKDVITTALGYTPSSFNSNYLKLVISSTSTGTGNVSTSSPYVNLVYNGSVVDYIRFQGSGYTSVSGSSSGVITITSSGGSSYTLPLAASRTRGGIQIGYSSTSSSGSYYRIPLELSSEKAYVEITPSIITTALGYTPISTQYTLPLAADRTRGGIQIGFTNQGANVAVKLSSEKAYVELTGTATQTALNTLSEIVFSKHLVCSSGAGTTSTSDIRFKNNLRTIPSVLNNVLNSPEFIYNWKDETSDNVGTSAQYWEDKIPSLVSKLNDDNETRTFSYERYTIILQKALKEEHDLRNKEKEEYEKRLEKLENLIKKLL